MQAKMKLQHGFTLIEVALALAISTIALGLSVRWAASQGDETRAVHQGQELNLVGAAVDAYIERNINALLTDQSVKLSDTPSTVYATNPLAPTLNELIQGDFLSKGYTGNNYFQGSYAITLRRGPDPCEPSNGSCAYIISMIALTRPITSSSASAGYDASLLSTAASVIGASAGWSDSTSPSIITGLNSKWTEINPIANQPAGILMRRVQLSMANAAASPAGPGCTCGDVQASMLTATHGNWKLLNGTNYSGPTCGSFNGLDARNRVLVMDGQAPGTLSGATPLQQNQLPVVNLSSTFSAEIAGTTDPAGTHNHTTWWIISGTRPYYAAQRGIPAHLNADGVEHSANNQTSWVADHSHKFRGSVSGPVSVALNPSGTQQTLGVSNLPRMSINYFVCVY